MKLYSVMKLFNKKYKAIILIVIFALALNKLEYSRAQQKQQEENNIYADYLIAYFANKNDKYKLAEKHIDRLLKFQPENQLLLQSALDNAVELANFDKAEKIAEKIYQQYPENIIVKIILTTQAIKKKQFKKVQQYLTNKHNQKFLQTINELIKTWVLIAQNKNEKAYGFIDDIYQKQPQSKNFYTYHYAIISQLLKKNKNAEKLAKEIYQQNLQNNSRVVQLYASILSQKNEFSKAVEIYDEYLKKNEQPYLILERKLAQKKIKTQPIVLNYQHGISEIFYTIAYELTNINSHNLIKTFLKASIQLRPDFEQAIILLAEIYKRQNVCNTAIQYFQKIKRNSPVFVNAQLQIAECLIENEKKQKAQIILEKLSTQYQQNLNVLKALANFYRIEKKYQKSIKIYEKIIKNKKILQEKDWVIFYFNGIAYERTKKWQKAEKNFFQALKLKPEQPLVLNYIGYTWIDKRINLQKALGFIKKALTERPNDAYITDSLGWGYYQLQKYDKAVKYLEQAILLDPADPVINDHLGDAYWKKNRKYEAVYQWNKALKMKQEKEVYIIIKQKIQNAQNEIES